MTQRIHLLRAESVTPIQRYLDRRRTQPADYGTQVEFACVLLYREREYRAMFGASWRPDHLPTADAVGPFAPYDLTPAAQAAIAATVRSLWGLSESLDAPEDLFGLKREAFDGVTGTLRAVKAHGFGRLVASTLARDLCHYAEAIEIARLVPLGGVDSISALALTYECGLLERPGTVPFDGEAVAADAQRRAHHYLTPRGQWQHDWHARALERLEERIRRRALEARTRVEGEMFARFLSTEADFCERERRAGLEGFDESAVPSDLRGLIALARRFGIGDDPCRALAVRRTRLAERRAIIAAVDARSARVAAWLAALGGPPYGREASCFFWLLEAVEEMTQLGAKPHDA